MFKKMLLVVVALNLSLVVNSAPNTLFMKSSLQSGGAETQVISDDITNQPEEKELEIEWNKWHAEVRNHMLRRTKDITMPTNTTIGYGYYVKSDKSVINVTSLLVPEKSLSASDIIAPREVFYVLTDNYGIRKFYICKSRNYITNIATVKMTREVLDRLLSNNDVEEIPISKRFKYLNEYLTLKEVNDTVKKESYNPILAFPRKSKRTIVFVSQGITNIDKYKGEGFSEKQFNDTERYKY